MPPSLQNILNMFSKQMGGILEICWKLIENPNRWYWKKLALFGKRVRVGFVTIYHNFPKKLTSKHFNIFTFYIILFTIYYYSNKKNYYKIKFFHFSIPIITLFFFFTKKWTMFGGLRCHKNLSKYKILKFINFSRPSDLNV